MPLKHSNHHHHQQPAAGDYYVHRPTGALVEIMDVDPDGHCMVLSAAAPLDGEWQHVTACQLATPFWDPVAGVRPDQAA